MAFSPKVRRTMGEPSHPAWPYIVASVSSQIGQVPTEVYKKTKAPKRGLCLRSANDSACDDVCGSRAFRRLLDVKRDRLTLGQRLKATAADRCVMDEDVVAIFTGDKSKTLRLVKPLYSSFCHVHIPLFID